MSLLKIETADHVTTLTLDRPDTMNPLGATGGMILGTMVDELERADKETALITLCVGAGMGTATIIERV